MIPEVIQQGIDASEYFILFTSDRTDFTSVRLFEESAYAKDKGKRRSDDGEKSKGKHRGKGLGKTRLSAVRKRLTEQQEQLETWQENRKQIVNMRVLELLAGEKRFPWGP